MSCACFHLLMAVCCFQGRGQVLKKGKFKGVDSGENFHSESNRHVFGSRGCCDTTGLEDPAQNAGVSYESIAEYPTAFKEIILCGKRRDEADMDRFNARWKDEVWTAETGVKKVQPEVTVTWLNESADFPTPKVLKVVTQNTAHQAAVCLADCLSEVRAPFPLS